MSHDENAKRAAEYFRTTPHVCAATLAVAIDQWQSHDTIWGFYEGTHPIYSTYPEICELHEPMTVAEANGLVDKIKQLEAEVARLRGKGLGTVWRHRVRGSDHTMVGVATLQTRYASGRDPEWAEGSQLAVYWGDDGRLWARMDKEFHDGRFVRVEVWDGEVDDGPGGEGEAAAGGPGRAAGLGWPPA